MSAANVIYQMELDKSREPRKPGGFPWHWVVVLALFAGIAFHFYLQTHR